MSSRQLKCSELVLVVMVTAEAAGYRRFLGWSREAAHHLCSFAEASWEFSSQRCCPQVKGGSLQSVHHCLRGSFSGIRPDQAAAMATRQQDSRRTAVDDGNVGEDQRWNP